MKPYPKIRIIDPSDRDALLVEVTMIPEDEAGAFVAEVAHELGALLGVNREVALELFVVDITDSIACPVPDCFTISPAIRLGFAKDVAGSIRPLFCSRSAA